MRAPVQLYPDFDFKYAKNSFLELIVYEQLASSDISVKNIILILAVLPNDSKHIYSISSVIRLMILVARKQIGLLTSAVLLLKYPIIMNEH